MKSDQRLQREVEKELHSDPLTGTARVNVEVHDGIVTLTGRIRSFEQKCRLHDLVKHVGGFKGLIVNVEIEHLDLDKDSNVRTRHELRNAPL